MTKHRRPFTPGASDRERFVLAPDSVEHMMMRYFFDIYDGRAAHIDDRGIEFLDAAAVRGEVRRLLPEIALSEVSDDDDRRSFVVVVRNDVQSIIYSAALTYTGSMHYG